MLSFSRRDFRAIFDPHLAGPHFAFALVKLEFPREESIYLRSAKGRDIRYLFFFPP